MRVALSSLAVFTVLSCLATHARGSENPEIRTSEVLKVLVQPLKDFSGYYISVDQGTLGVRGMATDPGAYLRAIQSVPMFDDAQLTGAVAATGPTDEEQSFALKAKIRGYPAATGSESARTDAASGADVSAAAGGIFQKGKCQRVSELAAPQGHIMFRWRCPTDLRGVSGLMAELESAAGGVEVFDFAVFEGGIFKEEQSSMDIRFSARPRPRT